MNNGSKWEKHYDKRCREYMSRMLNAKKLMKEAENEFYKKNKYGGRIKNGNR